MTKHDHHNCEHEVKYCKVCDVAYCVKCGKEWTHHYIWYHPYTYTSSTGIACSIDSTTSGTGHVH